MKAVFLLMMCTSLSLFANEQISGNCVGDGHIPGKSKENEKPLRASFEFDGSYIYVQVFGDDFDTIAIDYTFDKDSISSIGTNKKVIAKITEPELLTMDSEGSLEMKDLALVEIQLSKDEKTQRSIASLRFLETEKKSKNGATFEKMECEHKD